LCKLETIHRKAEETDRVQALNQKTRKQTFGTIRKYAREYTEAWNTQITNSMIQDISSKVEMCSADQKCIAFINSRKSATVTYSEPVQYSPLKE
jgi:hypothetical protein